MSVYLKGLISILACAGLFAVLAVPLILRKVPRNGAYGFRTPKTLSGDAVWYEANAFFGWGLLVSSAVSAVAMGILYAVGGLGPEGFIKASLTVLVAPPAVAVLCTLLRIRNWPDSA